MILLFTPTKFEVSLAIFSASDFPSSPVNANVKFLTILSILFCVIRSSNVLAKPRPKSFHASFALFAPDPMSSNICLRPLLALSIPISTKSAPKFSASTFISAIFVLNLSMTLLPFPSSLLVCSREFA